MNAGTKCQAASRKQQAESSRYWYKAQLCNASTAEALQLRTTTGVARAGYASKGVSRDGISYPLCGICGGRVVVLSTARGAWAWKQLLKYSLLALVVRAMCRKAGRRAAVRHAALHRPSHVSPVRCLPTVAGRALCATSRIQSGWYSTCTINCESDPVPNLATFLASLLAQS